VIEQMVGITIQRYVIKTTLMILDKIRPSVEERELLYNSLRNVINNSNSEPNLLIIKYIGLDCLQRAYIIDENGSATFDDLEFRKQLTILNLQGQATILYCGEFIGKHCKTEIADISHSDAEELLMEGIEGLEQIVLLKAWRIDKEINEGEAFRNIQKSHPFLNSLAIQSINIKFSIYEQLKLQIRGLKTIMAVLEFQEKTGELPNNLNQIQSAGLLQEIPNDPFSGEEMNYNKQGDTFTVYSDGLDLDDGGKRDPYMPGQFLQDRSLIIWPTGIKKEHRKNKLRKH